MLVSVLALYADASAITCPCAEVLSQLEAWKHESYLALEQDYQAALAAIQAQFGGDPEAYAAKLAELNAAFGQAKVALEEEYQLALGQIGPGILKTYTSDGGKDGWVLESSETSNTGGSRNARGGTARVGDDAANRQYKSILSFDTSSLPDDAVILSMNLKVKYQGRKGTSPFRTHGKLLVDMHPGGFSWNALLENRDFQARAKGLGIASISSTPQSSGWYQTGIPVGRANALVNRRGVTQFRLRFDWDDNNNFNADYLSFFSGDAALEADRPQLKIEYCQP